MLALPLLCILAWLLLQLSGVTELRRQVEVQLEDATAVNSSLQGQLDHANAKVDSLASRLEELSGQLASSSELGGSLRRENSELVAELAKSR